MQGRPNAKNERQEAGDDQGCWASAIWVANEANVVRTWPALVSPRIKQRDRARYPLENLDK